MKAIERKDLYARITGQIVQSLEQGTRPWVRPWSTGHDGGSLIRPLRHNGQAYSGINVLMLWSAAAEHGFTAPSWMTFQQALAMKANVRKGEKGSLVVYANTLTRTEDDGDGKEVERQIPFLKGYTVFNAEQIEGLPESYYGKPTPALAGPARIERAETFFANTKADIRMRGHRAYYSTDQDYIAIPPIEYFTDAESFYATLSHECIHSTRHPSRLDRDFGRTTWGDPGYAREELVAELGAAFLCADLELTPEVREDHASYLASWLEVLKNDHRAIFQAASHAQRAVDFLHGLQKPAGAEG